MAERAGEMDGRGPFGHTEKGKLTLKVTGGSSEQASWNNGRATPLVLGPLSLSLSLSMGDILLGSCPNLPQPFDLPPFYLLLSFFFLRILLPYWELL